MPDAKNRCPHKEDGDPDTTTQRDPSLAELYDKLADRPAVSVHHHHRRQPPRKVAHVAAATPRRHEHTFDSAGFCKVCQEHRGYLGFAASGDA